MSSARKCFSAIDNVLDQKFLVQIVLSVDSFVLVLRHLYGCIIGSIASFQSITSSFATFTLVFFHFIFFLFSFFFVIIVTVFRSSVN